MKRKIITIVAFLAVMVTMTGLAAAADGQIGKHPANVNSLCDDPIRTDSNLCSQFGPGLGPGDVLHVHFILSKFDAGANNTPWIYDPPSVTRVVPLPEISVGPNVLKVTTPATFTPNSDPYVDNPEETHHVDITLGPDVEFGAKYKFVLPVHAENGLGNAEASRNIEIFNPNTTLTKTASPTKVNVSQPVTYTYNEKNTGNVNLTNVKVTDDALTVTPVTQAPPNQAFNIGDVNRDGLLNPGETWTFTSTTTFNSPGTFTNTAHGHGNPSVNGKIYQDIDVTDPKFPGEVANATVTVSPPVTPCPNGECKFKSWGLLGPRADPEKTFQIFVYTKFMPSGKVLVQDKVKNLEIEATNITSVVTTEHTGTAEGFATVNGAGSYPFTVKVTDATVDPVNAPRGTFTIDLPTYPYHNSGSLSFGVVSIIKF